MTELKVDSESLDLVLMTAFWFHPITRLGSACASVFVAVLSCLILEFTPRKARLFTTCEALFTTLLDTKKLLPIIRCLVQLVSSIFDPRFTRHRCFRGFELALWRFHMDPDESNLESSLFTMFKPSFLTKQTSRNRMVPLATLCL